MNSSLPPVASYTHTRTYTPTSGPCVSGRQRTRRSSGHASSTKSWRPPLPVHYLAAPFHSPCSASRSLPPTHHRIPHLDLPTPSPTHCFATCVLHLVVGGGGGSRAVGSRRAFALEVLHPLVTIAEHAHTHHGHYPNHGHGGGGGGRGATPAAGGKWQWYRRAKAHAHAAQVRPI